MDKQITFDQLPQAISLLTQKVEILTNLIQNQSGAEEKETWFDMEELRAYLPDKPSKPTIYTKVSNRKIPFHKQGKKLYFLKSEIDQWLRSGRKLTNEEVQDKAQDFLK